MIEEMIIKLSFHGQRRTMDRMAQPLQDIMAVMECGPQRHD